jgi:hypothetical protein
VFFYPLPPDACSAHRTALWQCCNVASSSPAPNAAPPPCMHARHDHHVRLNSIPPLQACTSCPPAISACLAARIRASSRSSTPRRAPCWQMRLHWRAHVLQIWPWNVSGSSAAGVMGLVTAGLHIFGSSQPNLTDSGSQPSAHHSPLSCAHPQSSTSPAPCKGCSQTQTSTPLPSLPPCRPLPRILSHARCPDRHCWRCTALGVHQVGVVSADTSAGGGED